MAINQLDTNNTFSEWVSTTSYLVAVANNLTDGANGSPFVANSQIYISGVANHRLQNADLVDHVVSLVEERAELLLKQRQEQDKKS